MFYPNKRHLYITRNQLIILNKLIIQRLEEDNSNEKEVDKLKKIRTKAFELLKKDNSNYCILDLKMNKEDINLISHICLYKSSQLKERVAKEDKYNYKNYFSEQFNLKDYYIVEKQEIKEINTKLLYCLVNFQNISINYIVFPF